MLNHCCGRVINIALLHVDFVFALWMMNVHKKDVIRVSHRDDIESLQLKGQILERNVLVRALEAHLDERVILHNTKCVVFGDWLGMSYLK